MSDAQHGLPRYSGTGALGKVADALNLHSDCLEDLDATGAVSNARYSGRGGSIISKPRAPRGGSANHAGDFKRFALRIALDTDGEMKLFIGKGGVQVETSEATTRIEIAETKKSLIEDGIVYIDYTKGTATLEYGTQISPEEKHYYVRVGKTSKHPDAPAQWALPEQWLTTDAYLMLQGDSRVDDIIDVLPPDPVVTRDDGTTETKPDGTPVRSFADDYSFRCRVAKDGTTWKIHISDGVVHGRLPVDHTPHEIPATTLTLTGSDTHIYLWLLFSRSPQSGATFAYQYVTNASATYCPDQHSPITISQTGPLAEDLNFAYAKALTSTNPNQYATVLSVNTSYTGVFAIDGIGHPVDYENLLTFRIASIVWSNGVPSIRQRQLGDIYGTFRSML